MATDATLSTAFGMRLPAGSLSESPLQAADIAVAQARVDREQRHALQVDRQPRKQPILLVPGDRVGYSPGLRQHRDQRRETGQPRSAVGVAARARGAIEDRAHDLDRVSTGDLFDTPNKNYATLFTTFREQHHPTGHRLS
jgi:hypothetical protein